LISRRERVPLIFFADILRKCGKQRTWKRDIFVAVAGE